MRYLAQDIISGEMLHTDVPISQEQLTFTLSGPGRIEGVIEPEDLPFIRTDGRPIMEPWGVWLHAEDEGQIYSSCILRPNQYNGQKLQVVSEGVSTYLHGIQYVGGFSAIDLDIFYACAELWRHVMSFQSAVQLGVILEVPALSGYLLGTEIEIETRTVQLPNGQTTTVDIERKIPYTLSWYDNTDCGSEFDELAKLAPFDYYERSFWNPTKTAVNHRIRMAYPRLGKRRFDLRFVEDENLRAPVMPQEPSDRYASVVVGLGAGSDQSMIRSYAAKVNPNRLRRMYVHNDPSIISQARMDAITNDEVNRRAAVIEVQQIEIDDKHANAPIGSYVPGDEILLQTTVPHLGEVNDWHRIIGYTWVPWKGSVVLNLRRADSFRYGGV